MKILQKFTFIIYFSFISLDIYSQDFKLGLPLGHAADINTAQFNPEGNLIITTSVDRTAIIWDVKTARSLHVLKGHESEVSYAEFSADGKKVLTLTDNSVCIWNVNSGALIEVIENHSDDIRTARFSPNNKFIVTASLDNTAHIWNVNLGIVTHVLKHDSEVSFAQFNPSSNHILTVSDDNMVRIWDVNSGNIKYILQPPNGVDYAKFSPNGKIIVTGSSDDMQLWDTNSGNLTHTIQGDFFGSKSPSFSKDSKYIFRSLIIERGNVFKGLSDDEKVGKWDCNSGKNIQLFDKNSGFFELNKLKLNMFFNEKYLLSRGYSYIKSGDNVVNILDVNSGTQIKTFEGYTFSSWGSQLSSDNNLMLHQSEDGMLYLLDVKSGSILHSFEIGTNFDAPTIFSPDGKNIAAYDSGKVKVFDVQSGNLTNTVSDVSTFDYSSDDRYLVIANGSSSFDWSAKIWDIKNKKYIKTIFENSTRINTVKFNSNGNQIVVVKDDGLINIWEINSQSLIRSIEPSNNPLDLFYPRTAQFSPNDRYIISSAYNGVVKIWNAQSGNLLHSFGNKEFNDYDHSMANFSPDSKSILIVNKNNLKLKETQSANHLYSRKANYGIFVTSQFNSRGNIIISSSSSGSVEFWNAENGELLISHFVFLKKEPLWLLPNAYYMASKDAASKLYYKKGIQTIGFEQLDARYNRPDKVLEVLGNITGIKDTIMIKAYKKAWQKRIKKLEIDTTSFKKGFSIPESDFYNRDKIAYEQNNSELKLHIKALDSTYLLDRFNIWINEVPLYGSKGISVRNKKTHAIDTTLIVKLSNGKNKIETSILNVNGIESYRLPLYINYTAKKEIKEKLYFVGIGIDLYKEEGRNLNYSVKDIRDLSIQLKEKYGNQIEIDTLFNQNVTIKNIKELKKILKNSKVDDKVIISFSGHGLLSKDLDYYLGTYDVNFNSPEQNGLPYEDLEYLLDGIPSRKKLLLIDACHSGEVDKDEVEAIAEVENEKEGLKGTITIKSKNAKMGMKNSFELMKELFHNIDRATGATIISAAAGTQFAQERGTLKNGVFTYCILNQLKEKETITISELKKLVSQQVKEITNGLQQPTSRNETIENDWKVW